MKMEALSMESEENKSGFLNGSLDYYDYEENEALEAVVKIVVPVSAITKN